MMIQNEETADEPIGTECLEQVLRELGEFYFWSNFGNLGDYLIAEATKQLFDRLELEWKEFDPDSPDLPESYNLVFSGGGRFVRHWLGQHQPLHYFTRSAVNKCVILPHSIRGVDSFVQSLDERHVVFCREKESYNYCRRLNEKSHFYLADDLAIKISLDLLPQNCTDVPALTSNSDDLQKRQYRFLSEGMPHIMKLLTHRASVRMAHNGKRIAFLLRGDEEKSVPMQSSLSYDLSGAWSDFCRWTPYRACMVKAFMDCFDGIDEVVTDRLHAGIMAMLLGKQVYLLDNDYGKQSGIYEMSLSHLKNVCMLSIDTEWPDEVRSAWRKLNSPWRKSYYALRRGARKVLDGLKKR